MAIGKKLLDLVGFVDAEDENAQLEDDYHNDYYESYDAPVQTEERRFSPVSRFPGELSHCNGRGLLQRW